MAEAAVKAKAPETSTTAGEAQQELTDGFHLVIDALKLNGINTIYGVPGIPITDLGRNAQAAGMRVLSFRHEQNAGNAAAIAGFLTKKPGICLTVSAPGFLNGLTALSNATTNCFPMILVSGSSERGQAVEEAGSGHGQANAGLFRQVTCDRCGVAGVLLVPERDDAHARGLRHAAQVRDRNTGHAVDRVDAVELERIDDEVKAIRQLPLGVLRGCLRGLGFHCCVSHGTPPSKPFSCQSK